MRPLIDLAYRVQKQLWRLLRPRTRGVKVMLFNGAGELLLIRNNYGGRDLLVLPGGRYPAMGEAGTGRDPRGE